MTLPEILARLKQLQRHFELVGRTGSKQERPTAVLDALALSEAREALSAQGWQPMDASIEVDDGRRWLLVVNDLVRHGSYEESSRGGYWVIGDEGIISNSRPTHYMPWPSPPTEDR